MGARRARIAACWRGAPPPRGRVRQQARGPSASGRAVRRRRRTRPRRRCLSDLGPPRARFSRSCSWSLPVPSAAGPPGPGGRALFPPWEPLGRVPWILWVPASARIRPHDHERLRGACRSSGAASLMKVRGLSVVTPDCRGGLADQLRCGHIGPAWPRRSAVCQAKDRQKRGSSARTARDRRYLLLRVGHAMSTPPACGTRSR